MITYVSKVGVRSEHSLDDVMLSGEAVVVHPLLLFYIPYNPRHYLSQAA